MEHYRPSVDPLSHAEGQRNEASKAADDVMADHFAWLHHALTAQLVQLFDFTSPAEPAPKTPVVMSTTDQTHREARQAVSDPAQPGSALGIPPSLGYDALVASGRRFQARTQLIRYQDALGETG